MKLRVLGNVVRNALIKTEILVNRYMKREFIPVDLGIFHIETSSTCNLKCRFCAYEKKSSPKVNMPNEMFFDCVEQATSLGYDRFELTPCTGDVFMDKHVFEKFGFLDAHPNVMSYQFFTNLTVPGSDELKKLADSKKLANLTISIYGHDEESFIAITKSTPQVYQRLISNLETLLALLGHLRFSVAIGFRSTFDVPKNDSSELMALISQFKKAGVAVRPSHGVYNNWGGYISQEDVSGLNIHITSTELSHKSGACVRLFDSIQVMSTGVVNACACRDVDATLKIGDIKEMPLNKIIAIKNAEYMRIINEQQADNFRPVCKSCDFYKSIYHQRSGYRRNNVPTQTLHEFLDNARNKCSTDIVQQHSTERTGAYRP